MDEYTYELYQHELLSDEEERRLILAYQRGREATQMILENDLPEDEVARLSAEARAGKLAREKLWLSNQGLIVSIVSRYRFRNAVATFPDICQECQIGLEQGIRDFDYSKSGKFSTYATWLIRKVCQAYIAGAQIVYIPPMEFYLFEKVQTAVRELTRVYGRVPSEVEVARHIGVSLYRTQRVYAVSQPSYLDRDVPLEDIFVATTEQKQIENQAIEALDALDGRLGWKYAFVGRRILGLGCEPVEEKELARRMGLSQTRIKQIMRDKVIPTLAQAGIV